MKLVTFLRRIGAIRDNKLYEAFLSLDRADFLPDSVKKNANEDRVIPTYEAEGYRISTNSQPSLIAAMIELLRLQGSERILEIGTGTGYCTALLARVVRTGWVYSIDVVPELTALGRRNLTQAGIQNVSLKVGDGFYGWEEEAPFDAMIATVAIGDIPAFLFDQMRVGSNFVCPIYINCEDTPVYIFHRENESVIHGMLHINAVFIAMSEHTQTSDRILHTAESPLFFEKTPDTKGYSVHASRQIGKKESF